MTDDHAPRSAADRPHAGQRRDRLDTTQAYAARRYGAWLGGKDNFAIDRDSADLVEAVFPTIRTAAVANRRFLARAVAALAGHGIRQFLDIGPGLPDGTNSSDVAQRTDPSARVVYVDNDPVVLVHARALLTSTPEGAVAYVDADVRNPRRILEHPDLHRTLDLTQPVGLLLVAVLHFLADTDDPYGVAAYLVDAMPPGSYVALSHATREYMDEALAAGVEAAASAGSNSPFRLRTRAEIARFLGDLDLLPPGLVSVADWRPDDPRESRPLPAEVAVLGAVARIPGNRAI